MKPRNHYIIAASFLVGWLYTPNLAHAEWQPIIGIPEPPFGVNEIAPAVPATWDVQVPGFYYICRSCLGSTDTENVYGFPGRPRQSLPGTIPAGSVVEVHGQYDGDYMTLNIQGTALQPVFVRGVSYDSRPTLTNNVTIAGAYGIFENLKSGPRDAADTIFGFAIYEGTHHIAIRNCEFSGVGNLEREGGIAIGTWQYTGTASVSYILLDGLDIHDLGDVNAIIDQDAHGVGLSGSVDHLWLVNSKMARNSGDGIQIEARQGRRDKIHHVYVGNCEAHHNKQSGMWIKHATDVIFSQNRIYGHRRSNSSPGQGTGFQYGPDYVWFIYNEIFDNEMGIFVASNDPPGDGTESFFIGNTIYQIHSSMPTDTYSSGAFCIRGSTNRYIVNNTIHDADAGINLPSSGDRLLIANNIFSSRTTPAAYDIYIGNSTIASQSELMNNFFYPGEASVRIYWGGWTFTDINALQSSLSNAWGNKQLDPRFEDIANNNFDLRPDSPAIDAGIAHTAYTIFQARYGFDITRDRHGLIRPLGAGWDAGSMESTETRIGIQSPKNLLILQP